MAAGAGAGRHQLVKLSDATDTVPAWEVDLFQATNDLPDWMRWPIWPVMQPETSGWYAAGPGRLRRGPPLAAGAAAASTAVLGAWVAAEVVKRII